MPSRTDIREPSYDSNWSDAEAKDKNQEAHDAQHFPPGVDAMIDIDRRVFHLNQKYD